jgi:hypothetical protein
MPIQSQFEKNSLSKTDFKFAELSKRSNPPHNPVFSSEVFCLYTVRESEVRVKVTLEQATKAQRGSRGVALLFL